jgi:hypothetical protein
VFGFGFSLVCCATFPSIKISALFHRILFLLKISAKDKLFAGDELPCPHKHNDCAWNIPPESFFVHVKPINCPLLFLSQLRLQRGARAQFLLHIKCTLLFTSERFYACAMLC